MGVSKEIRELLSSAIPLKPHQELYIKTRGYMSGSVKFGVATDCSDCDFVLLQKEFDGMRLGMDVIRYSHGEPYRFDGYSSWYVKCADGVVFNLLVAETDFVKSQYVYATEMILKRMAQDKEYADKIKDKAFRIKEFQHFKSQCGGIG